MDGIGTWTLDRVPETGLGKPVLAPVDDLGVVRAAGKDVLTFLDRMFTVRLTDIGASLRLAGWADPKGRLIATLRIVPRSGDELLLVLPKEMIPQFVKRLRMYVFRLKVSLEDISDTVAVAGLIGDGAEAALANAGLRAPAVLFGTESAAGLVAARVPASANDVPGIPKGTPRLLLLGFPDRLTQITAERAPGAFWWLSEVAAGVPTVFTPSAGKFIPQGINWDKLGGVTFGKVCYPGQEVITRVHRAEDRFAKRMEVVSTEGEVPEAGAEWSGEGLAGTVVQFVRTPERTYLLLELSKETARNI